MAGMSGKEAAKLAESSTKAALAQKPKGKAGKGQGASAALDPAVIEAKRKARAEKKEREAQEKAAKEAEAAATGLSAPVVDQHGRPLYRPRQWGLIRGVDPQPAPGKRRLRVLSWNMLAQGLVRRKLFPGSDALRWRDREAGLEAELVGHGFDVGCFQEVDRIGCHSETLRKAGYSYEYVKGYSQKQHGLMLAWRSRTRNGVASASVFEPKATATHTLFYDTAEVAPGRTACSRVTRNIALFAAVKYAETEGSNADRPRGVILATTHLFWHPIHAYERLRQVGLLVRELDRFRGREDAEWSSWPCLLAGDFNDQPHSASYGLLTGRGLDQDGTDEIMRSTVIHQSIDDRAERERVSQANGETTELETGRKATAASQDADAQAQEGVPDSGDQDVDDDPAEEDEDGEEEGNEEEEEEGGADDQMLKNCRAARETDGLLSIGDFKQLCDLSSDFGNYKAASRSETASESDSAQRLRSAYASGYLQLDEPSEEDNLFSSAERGRERWDDPMWQEGDPNVHRHLSGTPAGSEPMWTLYSSLFGLTLDFIFLMPPQDARRGYPTVTRLLRTHRTDVVKDGLPRKGICVSDHIAIGAEIEV